MTGRYPPGTSTRNPNAPWNAPDMSHTHEWRPVEEMYPIFEDDAALFVEECKWEKELSTEEGYDGERIVTSSIPCEEQRTIRFEPTVVRVEMGNETAVYPEGEFYTKRGKMATLVQDAFFAINGHSANDDDVTIINIDPDRKQGLVVVQKSNYEIQYAPATQSNEVAD